MVAATPDAQLVRCSIEPLEAALVSFGFIDLLISRNTLLPGGKKGTEEDVNSRSLWFSSMLTREMLLTYDPRHGRDLVVQHANLAAAVLTLYALIVMTLPRHVAKPLHAPIISRAWNGALALFSAAGCEA